MQTQALHDEDRGERFTTPAEDAAEEARKYEIRKQIALVAHRLGGEFAKRAFAEIPHGADAAVFQDVMVDEFAGSLAGVIDGNRIADALIGKAS